MIPDPAGNIWEHSRTVRELYRARAESLAEEMDSAAQCAELLAPYIRPGARLLDAGCGSGYLWHSFTKRGLYPDYHGLDYSPSFIQMGREILPRFGVPAERLFCERLEDLTGHAFELAALVNTLTFCPDFREPLDRLMATGARAIAIRDNFGAETRIRWEVDGYLDEGFNHLKAYWNQWNREEVADFLRAGGYAVEAAVDRRCGGRAEMVVDKPYHWSWLLAAAK